MNDRRWELRPARDIGLGPAERLRSASRERGLGSAALSLLWRAISSCYLRTMHRLEIAGRENLPPAPFVMVANHASHLDALSLAAALPIGTAAFALAAGDTFFTSNLKATFAAYAVNALPIWRKHTRPGDLAQLRGRLLEDAAVFILFPEGTRSRTGEMARFKPGLGAIVAGTPIPVVPCHLHGAWAAWPPNRRWPRAGRLRLVIGRPLHFDQHTADRAGITEITRQCEDAVRALCRRI